MPPSHEQRSLRGQRWPGILSPATLAAITVTLVSLIAPTLGHRYHYTAPTFGPYRRPAPPPALELDDATQSVQVVSPNEQTVVTQWNRVAQSLVIATRVGPTRAANAYGAMHTAMYDAWTSFDEVAQPVFAAPEVVAPWERGASEKKNAVGWAAFRTLLALFPSMRDAMLAGDVSHPALRDGDGFARSKQLGERAAVAVVPQYEREAPEGPNDFLFRSSPATTDVDRWSPERVPIDDPSAPVQQFLTPGFGRRRTFGVSDGSAFRPPPPQPFLLLDGSVNVSTCTITFANGTRVHVSRRLVGRVINREFIRQVRRVLRYSLFLSDRRKLSAEFWEDGGGTSFPPGKWMTFGQYVSARDRHSFDDDVKLFFILGNALRDAGITTWNAKALYFYARPVRAVRDLGALGLIGFRGRRRGWFIFAYDVRKRRPGVVRADQWLTYQTPGSDPSPPFPEYTSGHSGFSASSAEVLRRFTGSDFFGGSVIFKPGSSRFEPGTTPKQRLWMRWKTFSEAADKAGLSRLHGGIHFQEGDVRGRTMGRQVGAAAFEKAMLYISGQVAR